MSQIREKPETHHNREGEKRMLNQKMPFIWYGGDYNPDQWDEATLEQDLNYFKEAEINLVTLPVFSWAKLEPEEGRYCFEWLDRILNRLWENGIYTVLATPTTAQPAWMSKKYPEVLPVDVAGRKRTHGMRVFFCVNSETYRRRAAAIAEAMAGRYGKFPGLAGWHVANEYGTYCYCENCQKKFRLWLEKRYGTIGCLNEKWTTSFWGRTVYQWDEIMLPTELNDDYRFNPAVQLDYLRFVTDSTLECYLNEADILRRLTPDIPVFSNISGFIKKLNQFKLVQHMDFAGWDNYPGPRDDVSLPAMKHDIMRALKDGKPYVVAEQSPNQQNWQPYNKVKRPGQLRTIAYQGLSRGADSCLYFQMRQSVGGQEKFHGAVISHEGTNDTRIFREIKALGKELKKLGDSFLDGRVAAGVGFLFDWESWWALELCSGPTCDMDYLSQVHLYYKAFYDNNIPVDMLKITSDFTKYKIVVAPLLYVVVPKLAEQIQSFVKAGGILIATYRTGVADENDRCIYGAAPGLLRETLGLWVEETDALYPDESNEIVVEKERLPMGRTTYQAGFLCDLLRLEGAQTLAVYGADFYKGTPCITVNCCGKGKAYYIACQPEEEFLSDFVSGICRDAGLAPAFQTKGRVELSAREGKQGTVYFAINHADTQGEVNLGDGSYVSLLDGSRMDAVFVLEGRDVQVFRKEEEDDK